MKVKLLQFLINKINALIRPTGRCIYGIYHPNGLTFIFQLIKGWIKSIPAS